MVVPGAERQLPRRRPTIRVDLPDRVTVAVEVGGDRLDDEDRMEAVRREAWLGGDSKAVQVVGARRARQGNLLGSGRRKSTGLPSTDDGRPALAAPRGRRAARSPRPAADAPAPPAGAIRFGRASVR